MSVFVIKHYQNGEWLYWQDSPYCSWGYLGSKYTKSWKTKCGAENFLRRNPEIAKCSIIDVVSENSPRANWRHRD